MAEDSHGMGIPLPADSTKVHQFPGVTRLAMEKVAEILAGGITEGQQAAVDALAEAAVAAELDAAVAAGTVSEGGKINESAISFSVVDEDGRRTWIEADGAGKPTPRAADLIAKAAGPAINEQSGLAAQLDQITGLSFSVVDEDGRRTWIEADGAGKPTPRAAGMIAAAVGLAGVQIASGPDITTAGDSLTAGAGGTPYPATLAALTGRTVTNLGVGGETSATIAGRVSPGRPWLATVAGGTIPASGGVTVTLAGDDGTAVSPLDQGSAGVNPVRIAGIEGNLTKAAGVYTFTRAADGAAVAVNVPAAVSTYAHRTRRGDITVMWLGQNDGTNDATKIIQRERAIIENLTALDKRWLVIGLSTSSATDRAPMEAQFLAEFGRRFINIRAYLGTYAALADAGISPTAQDDADIAQGATPTSLRIDPTHLNTAGYTLVAKQVQKRLVELGWL